MSWDKVKSEWQANITVDGKQKHLGNFEGNAHGEVEAALAYDTAARAVGRPETANLQAMAACAAAAPTAQLAAQDDAEETAAADLAYVHAAVAAAVAQLDDRRRS